MTTEFIILDDFRLPDYPHAPLNLDRSPLRILNTSPGPSTNELTVPIGLATTLYKWHPNALSAFLDLDAWFSMTWTLSIADNQPDASKLEIGRIGNQITFGALDASGDTWTLMLTYNIGLEGEERGKWIPNPKESMQGDRDVTDVEEIEALGRQFVSEMVGKRRWETGKGMKHRFFVEYAPMDVWGDGIAMNVHWLYEKLDLSKCTTCGKGDGAELNRCGRCGTATYCSGTCQRGDWAVHKDVCTMSMEDRGQALKITEDGGLIAWDIEKTYAPDGSGEEGKNPNFVDVQRKRVRCIEARIND